MQRSEIRDLSQSRSTVPDCAANANKKRPDFPGVFAFSQYLLKQLAA
jgi:hypothetical protein